MILVYVGPAWDRQAGKARGISRGDRMFQPFVEARVFDHWQVERRPC
jgi:hypothetical protein